MVKVAVRKIYYTGEEEWWTAVVGMARQVVRRAGRKQLECR